MVNGVHVCVCDSAKNILLSVWLGRDHKLGREKARESLHILGLLVTINIRTNEEIEYVLLANHKTDIFFVIFLAQTFVLQSPD